MATSKTFAPVEEIGRTILILRRQRIILDADLAILYGVPTFVRLRELLASNTALARKLDELERKYADAEDLTQIADFSCGTLRAASRGSHGGCEPSVEPMPG